MIITAAAMESQGNLGLERQFFWLWRFREFSAYIERQSVDLAFQMWWLACHPQSPMLPEAPWATLPSDSKLGA